MENSYQEIARVKQDIILLTRAHSPSPSPDNPPDQTACKRLRHSMTSQQLSIASHLPSQGDAKGDAGDNDQELTNTGPVHSTESADEATLGMVFLSL